MKPQVRKQLNRNRIIAVIIAAAVIFCCALLVSQILSMRKKNETLAIRKSRLDEQLQLQLERQAELEDEEDYIKTQEYIEEKAKSIGYVYPDEIIFKKAD